MEFLIGALIALMNTAIGFGLGCLYSRRRQ